MSDPKDKIVAILDKQRKAIEAQREVSKQIEAERAQRAISETALPSPFLTQPLNK